MIGPGGGVSIGNEFNLTLKIAKIYLSDSEDLIHKATGWMLREIGKRNEKVLLSFMNKNHFFLTSKFSTITKMLGGT